MECDQFPADSKNIVFVLQFYYDYLQDSAWDLPKSVPKLKPKLVRITWCSKVKKELI